MLALSASSTRTRVWAGARYQAGRRRHTRQIPTAFRLPYNDAVMGARPAKLTIPKPAKMPRVPFLTERELAQLVKVSPGTVRAWRRRGETPAPATGPEAEAFAESRRKSGSPPVVYRCSDVSALLFGDGGPKGRPKPLPASALRRIWLPGSPRHYRAAILHYTEGCFSRARAMSDCLMHSLEDINGTIKGFANGAMSGL